MTPTEMYKRAESLFNERTKRELADMVVHRESDLEDARAENAKLRDGAYAMRQLYEDELKHALAENAKLRELLDYMTPIAWYAASERERNRMRELGIEVDE